MKKYLSALLFLSLLSQAAFAQMFALKGKLLDRTSGEALIGASVQVKNAGTNTGAVTDISGAFKVGNLNPGTYTVTASYIGYTPVTETITIVDKDITYTFRLGEDNSTLNEVEIVADVAVERETPVAYSTVKESTIRESLAGRDLPLILNETPGVYATNQGGGPGESRISIRGFSQENIAVMVNGVPVNDMENGRVFWSNWDLGDVTKSTQVQRGLSASKLATPSVGGTLNIMTKGFENKESLIARQEIGSNNYSKTSLMYSTGQLKGDWAFTVYGSRRTGNGWVEGTWDDSWSYFANISKKFGNHTLSLTGLGSPQKHGQRSFAKTIITYDTEKARDLGANVLNTDGTIREGLGFNYNAHWGELDRFTISGNDTVHNRQQLNERQNYYHKPQFNLNHFWTISDRLFMSNVVYASIGNGGGVAPFTSIATLNNRPNFQGVYNANVKSPTGQASNFLHSNINNHRWYGFISGLDYRANDQTTISAGIDGRTYKGEHYREVYDLLGAAYAVNTGATRNMNINPDIQKFKEGDKLSFNNDGLVRYLGGFLMTEYKTNVISAFISGTFSTTNYKRKDYFLPKIFSIEGQEVPVGFYTNPTLLGRERKPVNNVFYTQSDYLVNGPDTVQLNQNAPVAYRGQQFQQVSGEGKLKESNWVKFNGYTIKGGLNYNLNEFNNIFFNLGYISKAPFYNNVFNTTTGDQYQDVRNEGVASFEIGYGINRGNFKANLNAYHTTWYNRSQSRTVPREPTPFGDVDVQYILTGLDARHVGVELELAQELSRKLELNAAISLGDWRWNGTGFVRRITVDGLFLSEGGFNADGVHVGGSAQNQFMVGVRYEPIPGFYIRPTYLMFAKNYADFLPQEMKPSETPQDAFRLPTSRSVDLHSGYTVNFYKNLKLTLNGSILNLLDEYYITDAPTRSGINQFDPNSIEVFFNRGRTFIIGASVRF